MLQYLQTVVAVPRLSCIRYCLCIILYLGDLFGTEQFYAFRIYHKFCI